MNYIKIRLIACVWICLCLMTSACAGDTGLAEKDSSTPRMNQQDASSANVLNVEPVRIALTTYNDHSYVSLNKIVNVLEFNAEWDDGGQTYAIGETDVIFQFQTGSTNALRDEEEVLLVREPLKQDKDLLLSIEDLDLFREYMNGTINNRELVIHPNNNIITVDDEMYDDQYFADDPTDPAGIGEDEGDALDLDDLSPADTPASSAIVDPEALEAFTRKSVNANRLIATGKKYMGVKYQFGAKKYSVSKRFDCSSFTQQLYGAYGVRLPRVSRTQAKYGIYISRKNLRKGDLLYFYVPGRFKTNKTVGHVGIYIGGGVMLHSSPKPKNGVQLTNINKSYWRKTYMGAKRVIK